MASGEAVKPRGTRGWNTQFLLQERTEGVEPVQPREETTERGPHQRLSLLEERLQLTDQALLGGAQQQDKSQRAENDLLCG